MKRKWLHEFGVVLAVGVSILAMTAMFYVFMDILYPPVTLVDILNPPVCTPEWAQDLINICASERTPDGLVFHTCGNLELIEEIPCEQSS